jgi:hypothetical protein
MRHTITTPVAGFTGISAGVNFTNGQAVVDDQEHEAALRYFRAQGYSVVEGAPEGSPDQVAELQARVAELEAELEQLRPAVDDGPPAKSAPKPVWVAYAVEHGVDPAEADASTKDQLIERFTTKEGGQ